MDREKIIDRILDDTLDMVFAKRSEQIDKYIQLWEHYSENKKDNT